MYQMGIDFVDCECVKLLILQAPNVKTDSYTLFVTGVLLGFSSVFTFLLKILH